VVDNVVAAGHDHLDQRHRTLRALLRLGCHHPCRSRLQRFLNWRFRHGDQVPANVDRTTADSVVRRRLAGVGRRRAALGDEGRQQRGLHHRTELLRHFRFRLQVRQHLEI